MNKIFNANQVYEIIMGMLYNVDISTYVNSPDGIKNFTYLQMKTIRQYLMKGYDVSKILKTVYSFNEMHMIMFHRLPVYDRDLTIQEKKNDLGALSSDMLFDMNKQQLREIRLGAVKNLAISYYYSPKYTSQQMKKIRYVLDGRKYGPKDDPYDMYEIFGLNNVSLALEIIKWINAGLSVEKYLHYNEVSKLEQIRYGLHRKIDTSYYDGSDGKIYDAKQMREIRLALIKELNTTTMCDPNLSWKYMRELRLENLHKIDSFLYREVTSLKDIKTHRCYELNIKLSKMVTEDILKNLHPFEKLENNLVPITIREIPSIVDINNSTMREDDISALEYYISAMYEQSTDSSIIIFYQRNKKYQRTNVIKLEDLTDMYIKNGLIDITEYTLNNHFKNYNVYILMNSTGIRFLSKLRSTDPIR